MATKTVTIKFIVNTTPDDTAEDILRFVQDILGRDEDVADLTYSANITVHNEDGTFIDTADTDV